MADTANEYKEMRSNFIHDIIDADLASGKTKRPSMYKVWKVCGALGVPLGPVMQMLLAGDEDND